MRQGSSWITPCAAMVAVLAALPAHAQIEDGDFELGFAGTFHSVAQSKVYEAQVSGGQSLSARHQVGGRIAFSKFDNQEASALTGFYTGHLNPEEKSVFFLTAGGGIGNGLPLNALLPGQTQSRTNFSDLHLSLGGGIKAFLVANWALRVEYAYNKVWTDLDNFDVHSFLFGISVFFKDG